MAMQVIMHPIVELYEVKILCTSQEDANQTRDEIREKTGYRGYIEKKE